MSSTYNYPTTNLCVDADYYQNGESIQVLDNVCAVTMASGSAGSLPYISQSIPDAVNGIASTMGGTYPHTSTTNLYIIGSSTYNDLEWTYSSYQTADPSSGCNEDYQTIHQNGVTPILKKILNSGDPLICSLRDYQCNGGTNIDNNSCFSDVNTNSTCPPEFRAPDTKASIRNLTQLCLGNYNTTFGNTGAFEDLDLSNGDLDFTVLWTNSINPNNNKNWTVNYLPPGARYQNEINAATTLPECTYNSDGTFNLSTCQTSLWQTGATGPVGPNNQIGPTAPPTYFPQTTVKKFSGNPPCQQLFWRILYGNQPYFQNNFWNTNNGGTDSQIDTTTSIQPQAGACGSIPFGGTPNAAGVDNARFMLKQVVDKYVSEGGSVIAPFTLVQDAPFVSWLYTVCTEYPYLCYSGETNGGAFLDNICTAKNGVTAESMLTNPNINKWCGCNMPDSQYSAYLNGLGGTLISKECTPYCNSADVIPAFDTETLQIKTCNQSLCVIDDVTITLARSRATGPITLNNICTSCSPAGSNGANSNTTTNSSSGTGGDTINSDTQGNLSGSVSYNCQCIMNNINITSIGATIEGGINIGTACNGNAKCFKTQTLNGKTQTLEIDCHSQKPSANTVLLEQEAKLMKKAEDVSNGWIIFIFIILIALIFIAWLFIKPNRVPDKDIEFTKINNMVNPLLPPVFAFPPASMPLSMPSISKSKFY